MPDKSTSRATRSRWPVSRGQLIAVLFATLMVASLPAMTLAGGLDSGTAAASSTDISPSLTTTSTATTATNTTVFEDSFENESADAGYPDAWEPIEDPQGAGTTNNYDTVEVTNQTASNGSQSFYGKETQDGNAIAIRPAGQPYDVGRTAEQSVWIRQDGSVSDADGSETMGLDLYEQTGQDPSIRVALLSENGQTRLIAREGEGSDYIVLDENVSANEWVRTRIFSIDTEDNTYSVSWESESGDSGTQHDIETWTDFTDGGGYTSTVINIDGAGWIDRFGLSTTEITGTVTDQDGNPVPNATVAGWGVRESALDPSDAKSFEEQAQDLIDEANDPIPDSWDPDYDLESHYSDANGNYLLVHESKDWGLGAGVQQISSSVDEPRLQVDSDQQVTLSMWDPGQEPGLLGGNQVDNSFPGSTTSGNIVVEQLSPTGGVTDRRVYSTTTIATVGNRFDSHDIPGVRTSLPSGVYVAYPEGARERGYTFVVGSLDELRSTWESQLRTEAGQYTDRAQKIRALIGNNQIVRTTTKTDENGSFAFEIDSRVVSADVKALKADGTLLEDVQDPSLEDLRQFQTEGYNGTFYLPSPKPKTINPPAQNVSVGVYRSPEVPHANLKTFADLQQWLQNQRLNETIAEIQSEYDKRFSEMDRERLEATYEAHRPLVENTPGAKDRYLERSEFDEIQDAGDLSEDELATETDHMQTALSGSETLTPPDPGDNPIDVEDGELNANYPIPGGIDEDTLQPEIHWSNGSSEEIPSEYWSVQSGGVLGGDELVIEGYPIDSDDPAAFDVRVMGAGSGGLLDDRISATNPSFGGTVPDLGAIDVSTMAPGDDERVSMTVRPSDPSNFGSLESVEVVGPEGEPIDASVTGDSASFTTDGIGEHFIRATITDDTGSQFVHTFSIDALEQGRSDPPTVRAETATGDRIFAVVGDGLEDGQVERTTNGLTVEAVVPGGEIPGSVHVKPQAAMDGDETTLDVRVLEGSEEATVSSNIETVIHLDSLPENSRVWRGEPGWFGEPLERNGGSRYGAVIDRGGADSDKVVIRTYTEGNGAVELTIDSRNGFAGTYDSWRHGVAATIPNFTLPFGLGMAVPAAGGATVAGAFLWFSRRRYSVWFWR